MPDRITNAAAYTQPNEGAIAKPDRLTNAASYTQPNEGANAKPHRVSNNEPHKETKPSHIFFS